ncbi:MAG: hypothetical protein ACRDSO_12675 [Pseudonocardiaceae bacterium]
MNAAPLLIGDALGAVGAMAGRALTSGRRCGGKINTSSTPTTAPTPAAGANQIFNILVTHFKYARFVEEHLMSSWSAAT